MIAILFYLLMRYLYHEKNCRKINSLKTENGFKGKRQFSFTLVPMSSLNERKATFGPIKLCVFALPVCSLHKYLIFRPMLKDILFIATQYCGACFHNPYTNTHTTVNCRFWRFFVTYFSDSFFIINRSRWYDIFKKWIKSLRLEKLLCN